MTRVSYCALLLCLATGGCGLKQPVRWNYSVARPIQPTLALQQAPEVPWYYAHRDPVIYFATYRQPVYLQRLVPQEVDSLNPTLQWEPCAAKDAGGAKYDLAVWECVNWEERLVPEHSWDKYDSGGGVVCEKSFQHLDQGKVVYEKRDVYGTSHKIVTALLPGKDYLWSVRLSGTQEWATCVISHYSIVGSRIGWRTNMFVFRTPAGKTSE